MEDYTESRIGQQFGNYRLMRLLGQGGFADVYLGEHLYLKTHAALKLLHIQLTNNALEDFINEARTIAGLEHPHIVRVLEFGVENRTPFLVLGYAPNGSLRQRHPKGSRIPLEMVLLYVWQIASALDYAHQGKLIHRDIKPENMLLGRNDEVLLSDFGLVLIAQTTGSQTTKAMAGTIPYMAPEQLQGRPQPASDQYALGIVVYEWLSGQRPFNGSFTEIASQHVLTPPPSLYGRISGISSRVEDVVFKALAKDPQQRFSSVQAFATALEQASKMAQELSFTGHLTPIPPGEVPQPTPGITITGLSTTFKNMNTPGSPSSQVVSMSAPLSMTPEPTAMNIPVDLSSQSTFRNTPPPNISSQFTRRLAEDTYLSPESLSPESLPRKNAIPPASIFNGSAPFPLSSSRRRLGWTALFSVTAVVILLIVSVMMVRAGSNTGIPPTSSSFVSLKSPTGATMSQSSTRATSSKSSTGASSQSSTGATLSKSPTGASPSQSPTMTGQMSTPTLVPPTPTPVPPTPTPTSTPVPSTLAAGQKLYANQYLLSDRGGKYELLMQSDGNLVLAVVSSWTVLWNSRTGGNPGAWAFMQPDGNFVVYNSSRQALWNSGTGGNPSNPGYSAVMQCDGNFVVRSPSGTAIWNSATGGSTC